MSKGYIKTLSLILLSQCISSEIYASSDQRTQALQNQPSTQSSDNFYDRRSEGWYWYEDPEAKKIKKQQEQTQQIKKSLDKPAKKVEIYNPESGKYNESIVLQATPATSKPLSVQWLREQMPVALDNALENPTDDNGLPSKQMQLYMYMQKIALDKSQNFAKAASVLTQTDPVLDETNRVPIDSASNKVFMQAADKDKAEVLAYLSKKVGLWFFYDTSCSFCSTQYTFLKDFRIENKFTVYNISMDGKKFKGMENDIVLPDRGQAKNFRLKITPSIVMIAPPNNVYIVSQGLMTPASIETKILLIADSQNLISKEMKAKLNPFSKGVLTPEQMKKIQEVEKNINDDPTKIVDLIRKNSGLCTGDTVC